MSASIVRRIAPSVGTPLAARITRGPSRILPPRRIPVPHLGTTPPTQFSTWTPGTIKPIGATDPGVRNVGHRIPIESMTVVNGDFVPTANTVHSGLYIKGRVIPGASSTNAIMRDCFIEGKFWAQGPAYVAGTPSQDAAVNPSYNGRNVTFEWCTIDMTGRESVFVDGVRGNNFTMRYCEIVRTVDGFGAVAPSKYGDTLLENCRIHNAYYMAYMDPTNGSPPNYQPYPGFSNQNDRRTHNDGVQIQGFTGYTIRGNYIGGKRYDVTSASHQANRDYLNPTHAAYIQAMNDEGDDYPNTAILVQNNIGTTGFVGALIEKNWLAGGDATVNLVSANSYGDTLAGVTVRDNRFIPQSTWGNTVGTFAIYKGTACTASISGNVWDDDGTPVPINTY